MSGRPPSVENRRAPRRRTSWQGACRLRTGQLAGAILDISAHGAFFAPEGVRSRDELARRLRVDEKIALRFDDEGLDGLEIPARVKWIGYSPTHDAVGFGVEFSHLPMA